MDISEIKRIYRDCKSSSSIDSEGKNVTLEFAKTSPSKISKSSSLI